MPAKGWRKPFCVNGHGPYPERNERRQCVPCFEEWIERRKTDESYQASVRANKEVWVELNPELHREYRRRSSAKYRRAHLAYYAQKQREYRARHKM